MFAAQIKELWLMLQLFIDQLHNSDQMDSFWMLFNNCVSQIVDNNVSTINRNDVAPKNSIEFAVWLLNGLATLYGYTENGSFFGSSNLRV